MINNEIEVSRHFALECCCKASSKGQERGICNFIKDIFIRMLEFDSDLTPKRAHTKPTPRRRKKESFPIDLLPSLKQFFFCVFFV